MSPAMMSQGMRITVLLLVIVSGMAQNQIPPNGRQPGQQSGPLQGQQSGPPNQGQNGRQPGQQSSCTLEQLLSIASNSNQATAVFSMMTSAPACAMCVIQCAQVEDKASCGRACGPGGAASGQGSGKGMQASQQGMAASHSASVHRVLVHLRSRPRQFPLAPPLLHENVPLRVVIYGVLRDAEAARRQRQAAGTLHIAYYLCQAACPHAPTCLLRVRHAAHRVTHVCFPCCRAAAEARKPSTDVSA